MNVIKTQNVEYDTISAGDTPWSDPNFPTSDALYWADHESETEFVQYLPDNITWSRVSARQYGIQSLWGPGGEAAINPTDLNQGGVGNCWIISAISAIAEVPGRVTNLMLNDEISEAGIYGVNMYALGVPYTEYVDDFLPIAEDWETGEMGHLFAGLGKDGSIWGAIVEKAYAKKYGNYQHTEGGWMATGVANLNGSPFRTHIHTEFRDDDEGDDALWAILLTHDQEVDVMTAGTANGENTPANLAGGHAYTIIDVA